MPFAIGAVEGGTCGGGERGFHFTVNTADEVLCVCQSESYAGGYAVTLIGVFIGSTTDAGTVARAHVRITHR